MAPTMRRFSPFGNAQTTYCASEFGWSDTWFRSFQNVYNQQLDVFSGEDSFNLRWIGMSGTGWLIAEGSFSGY